MFGEARVGSLPQLRVTASGHLLHVLSPPYPASAREARSKGSAPAPLQIQAYRRVRELSRSFSSYDEWVDECQPILAEISVPFLIINSVDDPVLVYENLEHRRHEVEENPNLVSPVIL